MTEIAAGVPQVHQTPAPQPRPDSPFPYKYRFQDHRELTEQEWRDEQEADEYQMSGEYWSDVWAEARSARPQPVDVREPGDPRPGYDLRLFGDETDLYRVPDVRVPTIPGQRRESA